MALKHVKKVEIKKDFIKENSVFGDFKAETKQVYKKCFDYDIQFSKINRLVRDLYELEKTGEVLVKYYGEIKNMFVTGIAISDYPTIQWMDFGKICETVRSSLCLTINVVVEDSRLRIPHECDRQTLHRDQCRAFRYDGECGSSTLQIRILRDHRQDCLVKARRTRVLLEHLTSDRGSHRELHPPVQD